MPESILSELLKFPTIRTLFSGDKDKKNKFDIQYLFPH